MAKFCSNCGSKIDDGDKVCGNCGTPIADGSFPKSTVAAAPTQKKSGNKVVVLVAAAIFLIVAAVIFVNVIGNFVGYKGNVRKMVKALQDYDMATLESLASSVSDAVYGYGTEDDVYEWYQSRVSDTLDKYEDNVGTIKKISFKISDTTELSDRRVEELKNNLVDYYNMDVSGIKKIMTIDLTLTVKSSKKSASYRVNNLYLIKESSGWKLHYGSLSY